MDVVLADALTRACELDPALTIDIERVDGFDRERGKMPQQKFAENTAAKANHEHAAFFSGNITGPGKRRDSHGANIRVGDEFRVVTAPDRLLASAA